MPVPAIDPYTTPCSTARVPDDCPPPSAACPFRASRIAQRTSPISARSAPSTAPNTSSSGAPTAISSRIRLSKPSSASARRRCSISAARRALAALSWAVR